MSCRYTGHDLLNPSCRVSLGRLHGLCSDAGRVDNTTKMLRVSLPIVCNGPKKCVFVRVVDSCAGCATGSKHVDMTKGAFSELADESVGVLNVQMRIATQPDTWFEDLWGPKSS